MNELAPLALKVIFAGGLVAAISQLSTALRPKMFAGLFAAAPSVALTSLVITALDKPAHVLPDARGMVAGALGMVACCLAALLLVPRLRSIPATAVGWLAWAVVASGGSWLALR